jgi:hypothetical protein
MLDVPARSTAAHEARRGVGRAREREHFARRERIGEARERTTDEQRRALPLPFHEGRGIETDGVLA